MGIHEVSINYDHNVTIFLSFFIIFYTTMHPVIQTSTPRVYTKNLGNLVPWEKISK